MFVPGAVYIVIIVVVVAAVVLAEKIIDRPAARLVRLVDRACTSWVKWRSHRDHLRAAQHREHVPHALSLQEAHEALQLQPAIKRPAATTNTPQWIKPSGVKKDMMRGGGARVSSKKDLLVINTYLYTLFN